MNEPKWKFNRDGVEEEVELERWVWGVIYNDSTELHQFDNNGVFHQIGEIDQSRVLMFRMYKPAGHGDSPRDIIDLIIPKGAKLIHKYRNVHAHYFKNFSDTVKVYMFGYKLDNHYHYNFILPDDRIVQSTVENVDLPKFNL